MSLISRAIITVVVAVVLIPAPASAQEPGIPVPRADLSAGYVFMRDFTDVGPNVNDIDFPTGWYFSGAFNPTTWFGIVGEVSGSYKNDLDIGYLGFQSSSDAQVYTFMGGARFFKKAGRLVPFAQILTGVAHMRAKVRVTPGISDFGDTIEENTTDFALQPGGGLTIYLTDRVGVRLAADYRSVIDFAGAAENDYTNEFRMTAGFTFQWGGR